MWGVGVVWGCVWGCVWVVGCGCGGKVGVGFVWTLLGTEASVALNTKTHLKVCMQMNSKSWRQQKGGWVGLVGVAYRRMRIE